MSRAVGALHSAWRSFVLYLEMIKVEHSIFALPFAMIGMMYADLRAKPLGEPDGFPTWRVFFLILVAMVSARSSAMAFNRIADRAIDAKNPRTRNRALPMGRIRLSHALLFCLLSAGLFLVSAFLLNPLAFALSPIVLVVLFGYSYTKRFTVWSHVFVGLSLGLAPAGAWIAVTGEFSWIPVFWLLAVTFWTAGFDILYSLQDEEFDRQNNLFSLPAKYGARVAIFISRVFHVLTVAFLVLAGIVVQAGVFYFVGVALAGVLLVYEQSLVKPGDLSRINTAFFTLNGYVSLGMMAFAVADVLTHRFF
jgi:4-hydroxybenzoate polyprenyltransferase